MLSPLNSTLRPLSRAFDQHQIAMSEIVEIYILYADTTDTYEKYFICEIDAYLQFNQTRYCYGRQYVLNCTLSLALT